MEDKQYLDEAGLGEVGKVISKFYASKEEVGRNDFRMACSALESFGG